MNLRKLLLFSIPAALLAGCSVNPRPSFDDANRDVRERTGLEARWMRTEAEEAAALETVRGLLREPLSPRRAAQIALISNRGLQAKLEELGVAHANSVAKGVPGNPEFEAFVGWPSDAAVGKKVDLGFGTDVLDLFLIPSRKRLGALELKQAKAVAAEEILRTGALAQKEVYAFQALESDLAAISTALEIEETLAAFAEARKAAGNLAELEYEEEAAKRDDLRARHRHLEVQVRRQREQINRVLGLSGDLTIWKAEPLPTNLSSTDPAETNLEAVALDRRFDLTAARAAVELLEATYKLQRRTRFLPAGIHAGVHTEKDGETRVTGPSIRLQLPLLNPGRIEGARLEALYLQATRLLQERETNARAEVRERLQQLHGARDLVTHYESTIAPRKKRIVDLTQAQFNMMLKGADDLLRAKRDQVEATLAGNEARRAYWTALVDLTLATGGSIPGMNKEEGEAR